MLKRPKQLVWLPVCAAIFFCATLFCAAALPKQVPDLSQIDSSQILPYAQELFPAPNGNFWVVSTNNRSKSKLADLSQNEDDTWNASLKHEMNFIVQHSIVQNDTIYMIGTLRDTLFVCRFQDQTADTYLLPKTTWDCARYSAVNSDGTLSLVTATVNTPIDDTTPVSRYVLDKESASLILFNPLPQSSSEPSSPDSSEPEPPDESSKPESEPEPDSQPQPSPNEPRDDGFYIFTAPVTIEELAKEPSSEIGTVLVTGADGRKRTSGRLVTGDIVEVIKDGAVSSHVTACVRGDLIGSGKPGSSDAALLYKHLLEGAYLTESQQYAADFDGDGVLTTSDLLALKKYLLYF